MAKVLLIGSEEEENLAIRYLAAFLKRDGNEFLISACSGERHFSSVMKELRRFQPDLVAVSVAFQSMANMFFSLIKDIKKAAPDAHITVGGHFPTFEYERILESQKDIDSVVRFEGEAPIVLLAKAVTNKTDLKEIPNLCYRKEGKMIENPCIHSFPNLDTLPFPLRREKPHIRLGEKFATIVSSRGCFHSSCLYCCIGAFHSKKSGARYATRSPENIAREISELYHSHQVRVFQFHDDNFMLPEKKDSVKRLQDLKSALMKEDINLDNVAFLIKARPDSIDNDVAQSLKDLGVVGVFLGVENASDSGLKSLIRGNSAKDIDNALSILKNHDMAVTFNLLIFHPNATLDEINENIYFIRRHLEFPLDFGRAEIVAGSPLERMVKKPSLIQGSWPNWDYRIKDENVDRLFQLNKATFRNKNSDYSRLAHVIIALAYQAYAINRLYPGKVSRRFLADSKSVIIESNRFILESIMRMYALAAKPITQEDIDSLSGHIKQNCRTFEGKMHTITYRMERLQALERSFVRFNISSKVQENDILKKIFRI